MTQRNFVCWLLLAAATVWVGCDNKTPEPERTKPTAAASTPPPPEKTAEAKPEPLPKPAQELLSPSSANAKAPDKFKAKFSTTKGDFVIEVTRAWAPLGADRFYNLVKIGYFNDVAFFRVVKNFVVQFGLHGHPEVNSTWRPATIKDDPMAKESNKRGYVTFAKGGADSRTTQVFISFKDNERLDKMGFPPFGKIVEGMDIVDSINAEYGESPQQPSIHAEGNAYLKREFPKLDYVKTATIVK